MTLPAQGDSQEPAMETAGSLGWKAALNPWSPDVAGLTQSSILSLCLTNPVIYSVEVVVCFVAAVNSAVKNVLPAAYSFSFSVTQESLIKSTSANHSCVRVEA